MRISIRLSFLKLKTFDCPQFPVDETFCVTKLDGFYEDPNNCTSFYQCLNGRATKRHCLKGMVFNALLKSCDTPQSFPCRTTEGTEVGQSESTEPEVKPTHRQGMDTGESLGMGNLATGRHIKSLVEETRFFYSSTILIKSRNTKMNNSSKSFNLKERMKTILSCSYVAVGLGLRTRDL